jgi:hypothetical protein
MIARRRTWLLWGGLAVLTAALAWWVRSHQLEAVTREGLAAARQRWRDAGWRDYDLELQVRGMQPGRYVIVVRGSKLERIEQNGRPLHPAAGTLWTVDGLFELMEIELASASKPPTEWPYPRDSQVWLRMRCHRRLGYPEWFLREVTNSNMGIEIRVTRLQRC